ncbi:MAG: 50S ribosomal protein L25/general stress protein Ctc [Sphingomonadales bacterium]|jgi:large subunit ribosomal protein L25
MANLIELGAESRERAGKGSARAARLSGRIPAVIYGDNKDPEIITIARNELVKLINRGTFLNSLFSVSIDGAGGQRVLPRDLATHPVTSEPMHVDLLRLGKGTKIDLEIPVHFIDEEESVGIRHGGILNISRHTVEVICLARNMPESIEVSIINLDIGDSIRASDLTLGEGVELKIKDRDITIAGMVAPKTSLEELAEDEAALLAEEEAKLAATPDEEGDITPQE